MFSPSGGPSSSSMDLSFPEIPSSSPSDTASTSEETPSRRLIATCGIGAVAAYVGYLLFQTYKPTTPQILWSKEEGAVCEENAATSPVAAAAPVIACVNFPSDARHAMERAMDAWLPDGEVQLTFPTVTFFDEEPDLTPGNIKTFVRQAAYFAFNELREAGHSCRMVAVHRVAVQVSGSVIDLTEPGDIALKRAAGRPFVEHQCLGFTVDGVHIEVVEHVIRGIIDASALEMVGGDGNISHSTSGSSAAASMDALTALRRCYAPSASSFMVMRGIDGASSVASVDISTASGDATFFDHYTPLRDQQQHQKRAMDVWWRSCEPLYVNFTAALRYARKSCDMRALSSRSASPMPAWLSATLSKLITVSGSHRLCTERTESTAGVPSESKEGMLAGLCGHWVIVFSRPESFGSVVSSLTEEVVAFARRYVKRLLSSYVGGAPVPPEAVENLVTINPYGVVVDLAAAGAPCTVLHAQLILTSVAGLLAAVGYDFSWAFLSVVVPHSALHASDSAMSVKEGSLLWKPCNARQRHLYVASFLHKKQFYIAADTSESDVGRSATVSEVLASSSTSRWTSLEEAATATNGTLLYVLVSL